MNHRVTIAIAAVGVVAAGCTPVDYGFGETHRLNIAQQVVDPDPQHEGTEIEGGSGERAADAADRYNRGDVRQPAQVNTTSATGSGGNSGSSSASSGPGPR